MSRRSCGRGKASSRRRSSTSSPRSPSALSTSLSTSWDPSCQFFDLSRSRSHPLKLTFPTSPPSTQASYDKVIGYIAKAKDAGGEIIFGGKGNDSTGFYVEPTIIVTKDPKSVTMVDEIFGPVLTVYVYEDGQYEETCKLIDSTTTYALTGCM